MPTALVTGASRGVGRGVAIDLADQGFTVFVTGRSIETADLPFAVNRIRYDHLSDAETATGFERIATEAGTLDVFVNSAWELRADGRRRQIHVASAVLGATRAPLDQHDGRRRACRMGGRLTRGPHDDSGRAWADRKHQLMAAQKYIGNLFMASRKRRQTS